MAKTKTKSTKKTVATKPAKAVKPAPTKNGTTPEAKKPGKVKVTKAKAEPKVKKAKARKDTPEFVIAAIEKARAEPMTAGDLSGPFKLTDVAKKAASPDKLNLKKNSARYLIMELAFQHGKPITREQAVKAVGDKAGGALSGMVRYGFLAA